MILVFVDDVLHNICILFSSLEEKLEWQVALLNAVADYTRKKMSRNRGDVNEVSFFLNIRYLDRDWELSAI